MLRASLTPKSGNRPRNTELTPYQRGMIVGAQALGHIPTEIGKTLNFTKSTVQSSIQKHSIRNDGVSKSRSGRPEGLSERDRRYIIKHARINPRITYAQIKLEVGLGCSRTTIYRALKLYGLTNWVAKNRPLLTPEVAKKRLDWCLLRREWTLEQWSRVIWSDECSVEKGSGKQRQWVFRLPKEKWNKEMIQPVPKGKGVSVMVWAAFWGDDRSDLYKLARDFTAKKMGYSANSYMELLNDNLLGIWQPGLIFMQDNAPIHKAKKVMEWFNENGIEVIDWPPYSPDLNPIEHVWYVLKKLVYQVNQNIDLVIGSDETVREVLWKALEEAWTLIDVKMMRRLIESMNRRIKACIASEGWYTKY